MHMIQIVLDLLGQTYHIEFGLRTVTVTRWMPEVHRKWYGDVDNLEAQWVLHNHENNTCDANRMYDPTPIAR